MKYNIYIIFFYNSYAATPSAGVSHENTLAKKGEKWWSSGFHFIN